MSVSTSLGITSVIISTWVSATMIVLIVSTLLFTSWPAINELGWSLLTQQWSPAAAQYGILPMLYGSAVVTCLALLIAVPLGVATAIFTSEILRPSRRFYIKSCLELLAGIPSILYGLIGVAFFSTWIGDYFALQSGRTLLTAAILLAIMVLPTIITLSDEALYNVPQKYREAAKGLGLYRHEIIITTVLPMAKTEITGAVLLALGRALGETMAVMLVIGGIDRVPQPFFNILVPGQTITSKLGREIGEAAFASLHFSALITMGLLLLLIVLLLTALSQRYFKAQQRLYE